MEIESVEKFEDGDIYNSHTGAHVGNIDDTVCLDRTREAIHFQVFYKGEWYVYQLVGVEKLGEESDTKSA